MEVFHGGFPPRRTSDGATLSASNVPSLPRAPRGEGADSSCGARQFNHLTLCHRIFSKATLVQAEESLGGRPYAGLLGMTLR